jgi:hypothetical protein
MSYTCAFSDCRHATAPGQMRRCVVCGRQVCNKCGRCWHQRVAEVAKGPGPVAKPEPPAGPVPHPWPAEGHRPDVLPQEPPPALPPATKPTSTSSSATWYFRGLEDHRKRRGRALAWMRTETGHNVGSRLTEADADRFLSWLDQDVRDGMAPAELQRLGKATLKACLDHQRTREASRAAAAAPGETDQLRAHKAGFHIVQGGSPGLGKRR